MKNNTYIHLLIFVSLIFSIPNHSFAQNIKEVKIGTQTWMAENLNVDRFRNGDTIPRVSTLRDIEKATETKHLPGAIIKTTQRSEPNMGGYTTGGRSMTPEDWRLKVGMYQVKMNGRYSLNIPVGRNGIVSI